MSASTGKVPFKVRKDITGVRFGRLIVIGSTGAHPFWLCRCDCGQEKVIRRGDLTQGLTKSCGCLQRETAGDVHRIHGMRHTDTYRIWLGMKDRCFNAKSAYFRHYGGRGITVCARWADSFEAFLQDMGPRPHGLSIDCYPNRDGNYEPGNCRWATWSEQMNNRDQTRWVEAFGQRKPLADWLRETGMPRGTVVKRLNRGMSPEEALRPFCKLPQPEECRGC